MDTTNFKTTILRASEGMYITQVADVDVMDRIISKTIALGKNSSVEDYKEITEEEGKVILEEQERVREMSRKKFEESNTL